MNVTEHYTLDTPYPGGQIDMIQAFTDEVRPSGWIESVGRPIVVDGVETYRIRLENGAWLSAVLLRPDTRMDPEAARCFRLLEQYRAEGPAGAAGGGADPYRRGLLRFWIARMKERARSHPQLTAMLLFAGVALLIFFLVDEDLGTVILSFVLQLMLSLLSTTAGFLHIVSAAFHGLFG